MNVKEDEEKPTWDDDLGEEEYDEQEDNMDEREEYPDQMEDEDEEGPINMVSYRPHFADSEADNDTGRRLYR